MTQLRENERLSRQYDDGMVLADLRTPPTGIAAFFINLRDKQCHLFAEREGGLQEKMGVWGFHITIEECD